jgi:hypothetical protein
MCISAQKLHELVQPAGVRQSRCLDDRGEGPGRGTPRRLAVNHRAFSFTGTFLLRRCAATATELDPSPTAKFVGPVRVTGVTADAGAGSKPTTTRDATRTDPPHLTSTRAGMSGCTGTHLRWWELASSEGPAAVQK